MTFEIVVACDEANGIGVNGIIPWRLTGDLKHFKHLTSFSTIHGTHNAVVMGRKTWESIPKQRRPLSDRQNIVISRNHSFELSHSAFGATSLDHALTLANGANRVFVIGGGEIYRLALAAHGCTRIHLTRVEGRFECDAFFPEIGPEYALFSRAPRQEEGGLGYVFECWEQNT